MNDLLFESLAGAIANLPAARAQPPVFEEAKGENGFARMMEMVSERKDGRAKEAEEQSPSPPLTLGQTGSAYGLPFIVAPTDALVDQAGKTAASATSDEDLSKETPPEAIATPLPEVALSQPVAPVIIPQAQSVPEGKPLSTVSLPPGVLQTGGTREAHEYAFEDETKAARADRTSAWRQFALPLAKDDDHRGAYDALPRNDVAISAIDRRPSNPLPEPEPAVQGIGGSAPEQEAAPLQIQICQIQTHLPAAIVNILAPSIKVTAPAGEIAHAQSAEPIEKPREVLKVLEFKMEPAALGAISVKLRVIHSRVEIQIAADNASTTTLLADTREILSAAIGDKGLTLDSYEVTLNVAQPSAPAAGAQGGASEGNGAQAYAGERGFANDDRSGQRQRQNSSTRRREKASAASIPSGVIL